MDSKKKLGSELIFRKNTTERKMKLVGYILGRGDLEWQIMEGKMEGERG